MIAWYVCIFLAFMAFPYCCSCTTIFLVVGMWNHVPDFDGLTGFSA
jgi:hypothetical protein